MSAQSQTLGIPAARARVPRWVMVAASFAVAATVATTLTVRNFTREPAARPVTGVTAYSIPEVTGTGPGLTRLANQNRSAYSIPEVTGTGPGLARLAGQSPTTGSARSDSDLRSPAERHARQIAGS